MKTSMHLMLLLIFIFPFKAKAQSCQALFNAENVVQIKNNQIVVNGIPQPVKHTGEIQYFRLRGGYGKDVPREKVVAAWANALDNAVKMGADSMSFYIPWDFHEYAPGKFDFTGTADQNGNGLADYPSRDLLGFLKMAQDRGIKKILLRPGPYINAEWGFLGFGAVPEWFHNQYPNSHMQDARGFKTKLYNYHDEDFLRHTKLFFEELNRQVLVHLIGKDKPAIFLQLDNETNLQWQSIYNAGYEPAQVTRYQSFLKTRYPDLAGLNRAQGTSFQTWQEVAPPKAPGLNLTQDQDWYRFQDRNIYDYIRKLKKIWNDIGVREPNVIFTMAISQNAPKNGLLPNYRYSSKRTGLMTFNIYPKTDRTADNVLLLTPHKVDHDIKAAAAATENYTRTKQEAAISPETGTGWFNNVDLSFAARQQTYLSMIAHGVKDYSYYYFNEGFNSQVEWGRNQLTPYFETLAKDPRYSHYKKENLPDVFWNELQYKVDSEFMTGWNVKEVMFQDVVAAQNLHFGAPLDANGNATKYFAQIEELGKKILTPYGDFLSRCVSLTDKVAIIHDSDSVVPTGIPGIDSAELNSDFEAGLVGYLLQAGINPTIHHWEINRHRDLAKNKMIFVQDSGNLNPRLVTWLAEYVAKGGTVVNFIGDSLARQIGAPTTSKVSVGSGAISLNYLPANTNFDAMAASVSEFKLPNGSPARPLLVSGDKVIGYKTQFQKGRFIQIGAIIHDAFNNGAYAFLTDVPQRRQLLDDLVAESNIQSQFRIVEGGDRIDVFGRKAPNDEKLWVTVKSGRLEATKFHVKIKADLIKDQNATYLIKNVLTGQKQKLVGASLVTQGFFVELSENGSAAFLIEPL